MKRLGITILVGLSFSILQAQVRSVQLGSGICFLINNQDTFLFQKALVNSFTLISKSHYIQDVTDSFLYYHTIEIKGDGELDTIKNESGYIKFNGISELEKVGLESNHFTMELHAAKFYRIKHVFIKTSGTQLYFYILFRDHLQYKNIIEYILTRLFYNLSEKEIGILKKQVFD